MRKRYFILSCVGEAMNGRLEFSLFDVKRDYYIPYQECISACKELHPHLSNIALTGITELSKKDFDSFCKKQ